MGWVRVFAKNISTFFIDVVKQTGTLPASQLLSGNARGIAAGICMVLAVGGLWLPGSASAGYRVVPYSCQATPQAACRASFDEEVPLDTKAYPGCSWSLTSLSVSSDGGMCYWTDLRANTPSCSINSPVFESSAQYEISQCDAPLSIAITGPGQARPLSSGGSDVILTAIVSRSGAPASGIGVSVSIQAVAGGSVRLLSGTTDANGQVALDYAPPYTLIGASKSDTITANCSGCSSAATTSIMVQGIEPTNGPETCGDPGQKTAHPILPATGAKVLQEQDWQDKAPHPLTFTRYFVSQWTLDPQAGLGSSWNHSFGARVSGATPWGIAPAFNRVVQFADGSLSRFNNLAGNTNLGYATPLWQADGNLDTMTDTPQGIVVKRALDDSTWLFDSSTGQVLREQQRNGWAYTFAYSNGRLASVANAFGRQLVFAYANSGQLASVSTPDGQAITYSYDATPRLVGATYPGGIVRSYLYEDTRWPLAVTGIVDEQGQRSTYSYDDQGRAVQSQLAGGAEKYTVAYGSNPAAKSAAVTDPLGVTRSYNYQPITSPNATGWRTALATSPDPDGNTIATQSFDINSLLQAQADFLGVNTTFNWDPARRLPISQTRAAGRPEAQTTNIQWHSTLRLPVLVTESGRSTAYVYDGNSNVLSQSVTDTTLSQTRVWQWTYNTQNLPLTATDPLGRVTAYAYDASGNNTRITNALGQVTNLAYDAAGRVTQITDPNGRIVAFGYDLRGRMISRSTTPAGGGTPEVDTIAYTVTGLLQQATLASGLTLTYSYDAAQRLIGVTDSFGNTVAYTLDGMGNRTSTTVKDALGNLALQRGAIINSLNRIAAITGAQGQTISLGYDANGEPISQTDPNNNTTAQSLDGLRRPVSQTFADAATASLSYNGLDQLVAAKDPKGVQTGYSVNAFGNVLIETSPDIGTVHNAYDGIGNLSQSTDARGVVSNYSYDALNRVTQINSSSSGTGSAATTPMVTRFTYDSASNGIGRIASISDPSGTTFYGYDGFGRVSSKTQALSNGQSQTLRYAYAVGGQIASITYPSGRIVSYQSTAGRVTGISIAEPSGWLSTPTPKPFVTGIAYTALGQPKSWAWASGDTANRVFDADGRMSSSEIASYTYDPASRITGITQNLYAAKGSVKTTPFQITYDKRDRVIAFQGTSSAEVFGYDANGNRTASTSSVPLVDTDTKNDPDADDNTPVITRKQWNVDPGSNRLLGFTQQTTSTNEKGKTQSSAITSVAFGLDAAGNQTTDGLRYYEIDASGRFATLTKGSGPNKRSTLYLHNALGQRVFKSEPVTDNLTPSELENGQDFIAWLKTHFAWLFVGKGDNRTKLGTAFAYDEGGNLLGEYGNGGANSSGTTEYIWLPTPNGNSVLVGAIINGEAFAVHTDHLGTPRQLTNANNNPVWQLAYSAFGDNQPTTSSNKFQAVSAPNALKFNLRFPGQYFDSESGLSYNYFRTYDARTGRYTQSDPIGLAGGINTYSYVEGNPISGIDPWGLLDSLHYDGKTLTGYDDSAIEFRVPAVSGPWGLGRLPEGVYDANSLRRRNDPAMTCPDGFGWSLNLDPMFRTTRDLLRIHPDGGKPGTLGCIGPACADQRKVYDSLKNFFDTHPGVKSLPLTVTYSK